MEMSIRRKYICIYLKIGSMQNLTWWGTVLRVYLTIERKPVHLVCIFLRVYPKVDG